MKTRTLEQQALYDSPTTAFCTCLLVSRDDGLLVGMTTLDEAVTDGSVTYYPGLDVQNLESTNTLGVDNTSLTIVQPDQSLEPQLQAGRWDNATFIMFEYAYLAGVRCDNLKRGKLGELTVSQGNYVLEFRGLTQDLQQVVGSVTSKTCRANFADYPKQRLGNKCGLDPEAWTVAGTVTSFSGRQVVTDSARAEADDYYTEGFLKFTGGLNDGFERQVKAFDSGVFTLVLPFPFPIEIGDDYEAIAGCRKRHIEDCKNKFGNLANLQAEPNLPGVDSLTKVPGVGT